MNFNLAFPHIDGSNRTASLTEGGLLFVLGANGVGKSSLMHKLYVNNFGNARRITAHRQTWFASNTVDMTPSNKKNTEVHISNNDQSPDSRWKDDFS